MEHKNIHPWDVSIKEAIRIQEELKSKISLRWKNQKLDTIAGIDIAYKGNIAVCAVIVFHYPELEILSEHTCVLPVFFPYVRGLLAFRELPIILETLKKVKNNIDVYLFDGHGTAHPRKLGLATHAGILLNKTSIGVAKSVINGDFVIPENKKGSFTFLKQNNEITGAVLRTKHDTKPVVVSPGNLIDLENSIKIVLSCTTCYRIPEPIRRAHILARKIAKSVII